MRTKSVAVHVALAFTFLGLLAGHGTAGETICVPGTLQCVECEVSYGWPLSAGGGCAFPPERYPTRASLP